MFNRLINSSSSMAKTLATLRRRIGPISCCCVVPLMPCRSLRNLTKEVEKLKILLAQERAKTEFLTKLNAEEFEIITGVSLITNTVVARFSLFIAVISMFAVWCLMFYVG